MPRSLRLAVLCIFLAACAPPLFADAPLSTPATPPGYTVVPTVADSDLARELDALFHDAYPADAPGAAVLVRRGDETLVRKGYGLADLELHTPMAPDMVFRLGSITKQFTAVGILLLEHEGKLTVDDPLSRFLPDYPRGDEITLHHLLTHTAGIPNYTNLPDWSEEVRKDLTPEEMAAFWRDLPLEFEPGDRMSYSNSGYFLLGMVIEAAAEQTYEEFVEERIFGPLGMARSDYGNPARVIPRRARGYQPEGDGYVNAAYLSMTHPYAAGSLLSTVDDLARWDTALRANLLLPESVRERLWTPTTLNDGEKSTYAYGWVIGKINGKRVVEHGGGIFGFTTQGIHLPDEEVYVAVLSNRNGGNPGMVARKAVSALLGQPYQAEAVTVDADTLADYVGVYRIDEETTRVVTFEDGTLYTQRSSGPKLAVVPLGEDTVGYAQSLTRMRFERDASGSVVGMVMTPWGGESERAERTDEAVPDGPAVAEVDPEIYDAYEGSYKLFEGFVLSIRREGGRLMTQATGQPSIEIFPESETVFFNTAIGAKLTFVLGDDGRAEKVILEQAGQTIEGERVD